jgi:hypothetical protein
MGGEQTERIDAPDLTAEEFAEDLERTAVVEADAAAVIRVRSDGRFSEAESAPCRRFVERALLCAAISSTAIDDADAPPGPTFATARECLPLP